MDKPGWQTTEFWLTVASTVFAVLQAFGLVPQTQVEELQGLVNPVIVAVVPLLAYIVSRTIVKSRQNFG